MPECKGILGFLFGHQMVPKYSDTMLDGNEERWYEGDVCSRCGHAVWLPDEVEESKHECGCYRVPVDGVQKLDDGAEKSRDPQAG